MGIPLSLPLERVPILPTRRRIFLCGSIKMSVRGLALAILLAGLLEGSHAFAQEDKKTDDDKPADPTPARAPSRRRRSGFCQTHSKITGSSSPRPTSVRRWECLRRTEAGSDLRRPVKPCGRYRPAEAAVNGFVGVAYGAVADGSCKDRLFDSVKVRSLIYDARRKQHTTRVNLEIAMDGSLKPASDFPRRKFVPARVRHRMTWLEASTD